MSKQESTIKELLFGNLWEYAPAPESDKVVKIASHYGHFINNEFIEGANPFYSINPSTSKNLCTIATAGEQEVNQAVDAAQQAFKGWSNLSGLERGKYLYKIGRIMQEKARELAVLETIDNGKPIKETRDVDIPLSVAHFLYYAGWADKLHDAFPNATLKPHGVVGQIIPWNFPLLMLAWKIAPALATGNTVVLKPAESTPLTAMLMAKIFQEAGLPAGVINIINGAGETGATLVNHPNIQKIAFTGSTEVGKIIQRSIAGTDKKLTLELGGKGANIIFEDAPIEQAIEGIVQGIFFNQGHVCCAGSRLLVQESIADLVIEKLRIRMNSLRVGDPLDKNTDVGAINSLEQLNKIETLVQSGKEEGAFCYQCENEIPNEGYFYKPTIFTNVSQTHRIAREEIFGPVLSILTFRTPQEAIAKANNTPYGLSGGIWSDKGSKLFSIAGALRSGVIWGNTFNQFDPASPFGGYKESGFGREGGMHGLLPYLNIERA